MPSIPDAARPDGGRLSEAAHVRPEVAVARLVHHPVEDLGDSLTSGGCLVELLPQVLVAAAGVERAGEHRVDHLLGGAAKLGVRLLVPEAAGFDRGGQDHLGRVVGRLAGGAVDRLAEPGQPLGVAAEEVLSAVRADVDEVGAVRHHDDFVPVAVAAAVVAAGRVEVLADLDRVVDRQDEAGVDGGEVDDRDRRVVAEGEVAGEVEGELIAFDAALEKR